MIKGSTIVTEALSLQDFSHINALGIKFDQCCNNQVSHPHLCKLGWAHIHNAAYLVISLLVLENMILKGFYRVLVWWSCDHKHL